MQKLRNNPLPSKLTQFRSIKASFPAAYTARASMLAQLHGYPRPAHVLAATWRLIDLTSLKSLKEGLKRIRDCAFFASEIISAVPLFKADKFQFQLGEVMDYIVDNHKEYGYPEMSPDDLKLTAYLVTSSETQSSNWFLDLATGTGDNTFVQLLRLYAQVCSDDVVSKPRFDRGDGVVSLPSETSVAVANYYVPIKDDFQPLSEIIAPPSALRDMAAELAKYSDDADVSARLAALRDQINNEKALFALSDLRLLDHVLMLMTTPKVWDSFISPRTKPDPSQNLERAKSLRLLAGYLQALLVYPYMLRYELFKTGYENLEAWHGSFPAIPNDVKANYEQHVKAYDFLGASLDAETLYALYHADKDPNLDSQIFTQFSEMASLFGIEDIFASGLFDKEVSTIRLDTLRHLNDKEYDTLLLSFPIAKFPLLDDLQARMLERSRFSEVSRQMMAVIMPGSNRYFSAEYSAKLHALNLRVPFLWHASIPSSFSFKRGAATLVRQGSVPQRYMAPWATAENRYKLRTDEVFQIFNANSFAKKMPWRALIDSDLASDFRKALGREWRSLYPAALLDGERLHDIKSLSSSPLELERLLELMTNEPFLMIRKALLNEPLSEIWATFLSSFCLIYRRAKGMTEGVLIRGKGKPYGQDYSDLAEMQKFDPKTDFFEIPDTDLVIAFLKRIPLASADMEVDSFHLQKPYYYFPGNGGQLEVSHLTISDGLLHHALRPVKTLPTDRTVLFDKLSAYKNDTLVLHVSTGASFDTDLAADEKFTFSIAKKDWAGDRATSQVDFKSLGQYGGAGDLDVTPPEESATAEVAKLAAEMKAEMERADEDSSINRLPQHAAGEVVSETAIASEINSGSGQSVKVTDRVVSDGDKKKKKTPESDDKSKD